MNDWFVSDTHFGHNKILEYCPNRPFGTIEEMNEGLIERWNDRVNPEDHVYHLGDFSFMDKYKTEEILKRLNGHIHLILGNHDRVFDSNLKHYLTEMTHYKELSTKKFGVPCVLFHFPIESWNRMHYGSVSLHGHTHNNTSFGRASGIKNRMDVGIDTRTDCSPWSWDEIKEKLDLQ